MKHAVGWVVTSSLVVGAIAAGGCYEPDDTLINFTTVTATTGATGTGGGSALTAQEYFETELKPELLAFCAGSDCHSSGARAFLLAGQEYSVITQYKTAWGSCLLTDPAELSPLLTYPDAEEHTGRSWEGIEDVRSKALTWLALEADKDTPTGCSQVANLLQLGPLDPAGFTVVPLGGLGAELSGFVMTFYASELGDPPSVLKLSDISIWPANNRGLRVVNPTFVFIPKAGGGVFDKSFHGDAHVFVAPDRVRLGSGTLLTTSWGPNHQLAIQFESVELLYADDDGNTFPACTRVDLFTKAVDALPFSGAANAPNGLGYCAAQCHGGDAGAAPTAVMQLGELLSAPRDDALACAKTRPFITPTQVQASALVQVTDPQGTAPHPYKFGGNGAAHAAFADAMRPWIDAEGTSQ